MKSQNEMVLNHLKRKPLTPLEAIQKYGIHRLSARIYDLKRLGYQIDSTIVEKLNRFGKKVKVSKYELLA
jgi:hypothetical protein